MTQLPRGELCRSSLAEQGAVSSVVRCAHLGSRVSLRERRGVDAPRIWFYGLRHLFRGALHCHRVGRHSC